MRHARLCHIIYVQNTLQAHAVLEKLPESVSEGESGYYRFLAYVRAVRATVRACVRLYVLACVHVPTCVARRIIQQLVTIAHDTECQLRLHPILTF